MLGGDFNLVTNLGERREEDDSWRNTRKLSTSLYPRARSLTYKEEMDGTLGTTRGGGEHLVASRLGHFLVFKNIMHSMGEIMANVLPAAGSDHWPISLTWDWSCSPMGKTVHFEHF